MIFTLRLPCWMVAVLSLLAAKVGLQWHIPAAPQLLTMLAFVCLCVALGASTGVKNH